ACCRLRRRASFPTRRSSDLLAYGYDNSRRVEPPDALVFSTTHDEVAALVATCRKHRVPLIARGRGTNTTGATVPIAGGVVASFEDRRSTRLNSSHGKTSYAV